MVVAGVRGVSRNNSEDRAKPAVNECLGLISSMEVETSGLPVTREQSGRAPLRSASKQSVEMILSFWDKVSGPEGSDLPMQI